LIQLFQNLIGNAIKYRVPTVRPDISIFVRDREGGWAIGVRDNGIGFPDDSAEVIFQPFRRLHSKSEYPGTGLGLATCRKIVEKHGGVIWAESAPGHGSTFFFTLSRGESLLPFLRSAS
jgi:signal transduction histidine kinase